jgi:Zn-dependent metalloprotease
MIMKRIIFILFILTSLCQFTYSQILKQELVKSVFLSIDTGEMDLRTHNAGIFLNTLLNISNNYEFRIQTIEGSKELEIEIDELGFVHERYNQYYKGIKIEDADIRTHYINDVLVLVNGEYIDAPNIDNDIQLTEDAAIAEAIAYINAQEYMWEDEANNNWLKNHFNDETASYYPKTELVICMNGFNIEDTLFYAAYKIDIHASYPESSNYVYVNARTGDILDVESMTYAASGTADTRYSGNKTITTQYKSNTYKLIGHDGNRKVETYNMYKGTNFGNATDFTDNDNYWSSSEFHNANKDDAALDAHWGAMMTYDYFKNVHNRNSYNNRGATIKNYVHYDINLANAEWNNFRSVICYGDGDGSLGPWVCLDQVAHEFGHAVCTHSAKLKNNSEPGAIGESLSDIWGVCVENYVNVSNYVSPLKDIWMHGEDKGTSDQIRSLKNPALSLPPQPSTYGAGPYWHPNSGVHTNSGIMNHWFYLLSEGGIGTNDWGNSYHLSGIGIDKAAAIVYRAETKYMTKNTKFADARKYAIKAAEDLYGDNSCEVQYVAKAWYAVGVDAGLDCKVKSITNKNYNNGKTHNIEGCKVEISGTIVHKTTAVNVKADYSVVITPGFTVDAGSYFKAYIYPSSDCSGGYRSSMLFTQDNQTDDIDNSFYDIPPVSLTGKNLQNEENQNKQVILYPNPNSGAFQLEANFPLSDIGNLKIVNLLGVPVYETQTLTSNTIQLRNSASGQHFVVMVLKDGTVLTQKMMVQR